MSTLSSAARSLLLELRADPRWQEVLEALPAPQLPSFNPLRGDPATAHYQWIFQSGADHHHKGWMAVLNGE